MGAKGSVFGSKISENDDDSDDDITNEEGISVFSSSSWLPGSDSKYGYYIVLIPFSSYLSPIFLAYYMLGLLLLGSTSPNTKLFRILSKKCPVLRFTKPIHRGVCP